GLDIRSITPDTFIQVASAQLFTFSCHTCLDGSGRPSPRTVSVPVLGYTITFPGGDTQGFGNVEYRIPIVGRTVQSVLFFDGGTNGILRKNALQLDKTGFDNLTTQFPTAQHDISLTRQLGISPGTNSRLPGYTGIEFVAQLPLIQAP